MSLSVALRWSGVRARAPSSICLSDSVWWTERGRDGGRDGGTESASLPPFSHLPVTEMEDETDDGGVRGRALPRIASSAIYQSTYDVGAPLNAAVVASEAGDGFDDRGVGVAGATFGFFHARTHARPRSGSPQNGKN